MQNPFYNSTIALAGIVQAICLIRELAQTGKLNEHAFEASIFSIFQTNPNDSISVYKDLTGLKLGLEKIVHLFSANTEISRQIMRYILSLIHLQKKISGSPKLLKQLTTRLDQIKKQVDYFHLTHPTVIANLADTYMHTINTFKFKIIIWGTQRSLSITDNMDKIRSILLAGVRSAVLWQQTGGSRIHLLVSRSKFKATAEKFLNEINLIQPSPF